MKVTRAVAAAAVVVVLATGCSAHPGAAAVVDGRTISQQYLDDTHEQISGLGIDKPTTLALIIAAPYFIQAAADNGVGVSEAEARAVLEEGFGEQAELARVSAGTVEFLRFRMAVQNLESLPDGAEVLALEMDINPRYGDMDPVTGLIGRAPLPWIVTE